MCVLIFFNDTATTEIYALSLHDALPILPRLPPVLADRTGVGLSVQRIDDLIGAVGSDEGEHLSGGRSEEHTSELQSRQYIVCRFLLEKKNNYYFSRRFLIPLMLLWYRSL